MFFNNLIIYKFKSEVTYNQSDFEEALKQDCFRPCGSQEMSTFGWAKPFAKHGNSLSQFSEDFILICAKREDKLLPAAVINEILDERIETIELEENRLLKRKEKHELKESIITTLLPQAFTKSSLQFAYIDLKNQLLIVNSASFNKAEELTALLRKSLGTLPILPAFISFDLDLHLTNWLANDCAPKSFLMGCDAELQVPDDKGSIVKLKGHDLCCEEVKTHLDNSKRVTKLSFNWRDRLGFYFSNDGSIKKVTYSNALTEQNADIPKEDAALKLDADFILVASEISEMVNDLINNAFAQIDTPSNEPTLENKNNKTDPLYIEALKVVQEAGKVSVSFLQRKLRIGYNNAALIVEQMEANGEVTEPLHNGAREVINHG